MKAICIYQPWIEAILRGDKCIETRGWETKHRGPLLLHAGLSNAGNDDGSGDWDEVWLHLPMEYPGFRDLTKGAILGVCDLVECAPFALSGGRTVLETATMRVPVDSLELRLGDCTPRRFGWVLQNVTRFSQPIPYKGRQRIFNVPDELIPEEYRR